MLTSQKNLFSNAFSRSWSLFFHEHRYWESLEFRGGLPVDKVVVEPEVEYESFELCLQLQTRVCLLIEAGLEYVGRIDRLPIHFDPADREFNMLEFVAIALLKAKRDRGA